MRTQLLFKTNEINSTTRRPTKAAPQPPPASSQMPGWNSSVPGPSTRRSPRKPPPGMQFPAPPLQGSPRRNRTQAPPASQQPNLPGFVNAFLPASQMPTTPRRDKGKARAEPTQSNRSGPQPADDAEEAAFFGAGSGDTQQDDWQPPPQPQWTQLQAPSPPISPQRPRRTELEMEVDTSPARPRRVETDEEKEGRIVPPDWITRVSATLVFIMEREGLMRIQLRQMLHTHIYEPTRINTFQACSHTFDMRTFHELFLDGPRCDCYCGREG